MVTSSTVSLTISYSPQDTEVYRKLGDPETDKRPPPLPEPEKESLSCYSGSSCDPAPTDILTIQPSPMLVSIG